MNRKWRRRLLRTLLILLILTYFLPLITRLMPNGMTKKETAAFFTQHHVPYTDSFIEINHRKLHYVAAGNDTLPILLFIHGSPGSWDAFKEYLISKTLLQKAYIISFDRAGYGLSGQPGFASLEDQVNFIEPILKLRKNKKPITVIGHSYGGPVSVVFCLRHQDLIKKLILTSPTLSPDIEEHITWKRNLQKFTKWPLFKWMFPQEIENSTNEMQPLPSEVRKFEPQFAEFKKPILEIHGTKDNIAPYGNQSYIQRIFANAPVSTINFTGKGHLIPYTEIPSVIAILSEQL